MPEYAVLGHCADFGHWIHAHASGHEGHVVDDARQNADDACYEVVVAVEGCVEPFAEGGEHADFLQARNGHKYAEEEEYRAHVDARYDVCYALLRSALVVVFGQVAVEYLSGRPQHAEHQQYAYERGQMGDRLEYGDEHQSAYADPEHGLALPVGEVVGHRRGREVGPAGNLSLKF